jgi:hypothetical protein
VNENPGEPVTSFKPNQLLSPEVTILAVVPPLIVEVKA